MRLLSLFAVAMAGLIAVPALAQTPPPDGTPTRVRGTVEKLDDHNLTVKSRDGQSLSITLAPDVDSSPLSRKASPTSSRVTLSLRPGSRIRTARFTQSRLASSPKRRLMAAGNSPGI